MKDYVSGVIEHSGKMVILMEIIDQCVTTREKILIFRYLVTTVCIVIPVIVLHLRSVCLVIGTL